VLPIPTESIPDKRDGRPHLPNGQALTGRSATADFASAVRETEREEARDRFEQTVLPLLREWCVTRADRVLACYVRLFPDADHLRVYVFNLGTAYDFDLAPAVTELELSIHRAGWRVLVRQMTAVDDPSDLFSPEQAIQVYLNPAAVAHAESGAAPDPG
jgi:hypothetical protein